MLNLLKLSDKYGAPRLQNRIIEGIIQMGLFPTTYQGFQEMTKRERKLFNDPVSVLRFIEVACNVAPYFLPSAWLLLSTFRNVRRKLRFHPELYLPPQFSEQRARIYNIAVCDVFSPLCNYGCFANDPLCSVATPDRRAAAQKDFCPDGRLACPFYTIKPENMRCAVCRGYLLDGDTPAKLQRYWDELPSIFHLQSWEELLRYHPVQSTVPESDTRSTKSKL